MGLSKKGPITPFEGSWADEEAKRKAQPRPVRVRAVIETITDYREVEGIAVVEWVNSEGKAGKTTGLASSAHMTAMRLKWEAQTK